MSSSNSKKTHEIWGEILTHGRGHVRLQDITWASDQLQAVVPPCVTQQMQHQARAVQLGGV